MLEIDERVLHSPIGLSRNAAEELLNELVLRRPELIDTDTFLYEVPIETPANIPTGGIVFLSYDSRDPITFLHHFAPRAEMTKKKISCDLHNTASLQQHGGYTIFRTEDEDDSSGTRLVVDHKKAEHLSLYEWRAGSLEKSDLSVWNGGDSRKVHLSDVALSVYVHAYGILSSYLYPMVIA